MSTVNVGIDDKEFELLKMVMLAHPDWPAVEVAQFTQNLLAPYRPSRQKREEDEKMAWPIEVLDRSPYFNARLKNILMAEGAYTIGDVMKMREIDWLKTPNMGRRSLNCLKECLAMIGLTLRS